MLKTRVHLWSVMAAFALTAACGSEVSPPDDDDKGDEAGSSDESATSDEDEAKDEDPKRDASTGSSRADAGGSKPKDGTTGADAGAGNAAEAIPCEVNKVLATHCLDCHGTTPKYGASFSLTTLASFRGPSDTDEDMQMHEMALSRVSATDKKRMPPVSKDALEDAELKQLTDWLKGGAKAGKACAEGELVPDEDKAPEPTAGGSGNASATPIKYDDPDLKCYPLTAFSARDRKAPYSVPTEPDLYVAFNIDAPWEGKQYVRSFRSIIDNEEVLHHWLLFKQPTGGAETVVEDALGAHPEGQMLYGWAPGGDDLYFDPDVAMEVDGSVLYQLELHYNNKTGSAKPDASGVEVCVTPTKPKHVAGLSWVGTDAINGTSATGRCAHMSSEPVHLIVAQPHMHVKGKNMKVTVTRKNGTMETIHDEPFDFNNQRSYMFQDLVINPGDVMHTTCEYSQPAEFGKATTAEMCYFFSIHWPAGSLTSLGLGTIIHGANSCMDI